MHTKYKHWNVYTEERHVLNFVGIMLVLERAHARMGLWKRADENDFSASRQKKKQFSSWQVVLTYCTYNTQL